MWACKGSEATDLSRPKAWSKLSSNAGDAKILVISSVARGPPLWLGGVAWADIEDVVESSSAIASEGVVPDS